MKPVIKKIDHNQISKLSIFYLNFIIIRAVSTIKKNVVLIKVYFERP